MAVVAVIALSSVAIPSLGNTITPQGIVIHHAGGTYTSAGAPLNAETISDAHLRRGFSAFYWGRTYHIGYHYLILPDGTVQKGRPDNCRGAHASGHNTFLGICLVGDFDSQSNPDGRLGSIAPSDRQLKSLVSLTHDLLARHDLRPEDVVTHRDVNENTACPGDRFPWTKYRTAIER
jgi:hypothetical protein